MLLNEMVEVIYTINYSYIKKLNFDRYLCCY